MAPNPISITFQGFCAKKNRKAPRRDGKGVFIEPRTREMLQRMEMQVPGDARDLMLESPEVEWMVTYTNGHVDMDGIMTTVLDILQKYRVIRNDNVTHFSGKQTIWPPARGDYDSVQIILIPRAQPEPAEPRYATRRKARRQATMAPVAPEPMDFLEDVPEEFACQE